MRFSLLLFALAHLIKIASLTNARFKAYISKAQARILIRTDDGQRARLFMFDKGKFTSVAGNQKNFDAALIWKDAATGFAVMISKKPDASFNAAAEGKLRVEGMSVYAQWFEDGLKLIL